MKSEFRLARSPVALVPLIKEDIVLAREAGVPYYRAAGEKLWEAKSQLSHGEWVPWLAKNFGINRGTAWAWMKLADHAAFKPSESNVQRAKHLPIPKTLSEVVDPRHPGHRPDWHKPVRKILVGNRFNLDRMKQEVQRKEQEQKLRRTLGLQLIDIGYKVLATKLHPDKGGSREAMTRLNYVREILKGALNG